MRLGACGWVCVVGLVRLGICGRGGVDGPVGLVRLGLCTWAGVVGGWCGWCVSAREVCECVSGV